MWRSPSGKQQVGGDRLHVGAIVAEVHDRRQGGTLRRVRRLMWTLARIALLLAAMALLRQVLLDRGPRQTLHGDDPVIGSLDTWPDVPRKPPG
jgi:hypothetical protein